MKPPFKTLVGVIPVILLFVSCGKEGSSEGATGDCNNTVQRVKKLQATFDDQHYIEAAWNGDGTIQWLKINVPLSNYSTAKYTYAGGKITEAVLFDNENNDSYDTVVYRYNAQGKVDSMYRKVDDGFGIRLSYNAEGRIIKYTRYTGPSSILFYWDIVTDANDNIIKADEYWNESGNFVKQTTYTFTRDTKKNPFAGLAPHMMYLNDDYEAFWYWGPNNFIDQRYQDFTGTGIDLTTGHKYKYNNNCYPATSQNTIMGQTIFADDDFTYTYY